MTDVIGRELPNNEAALREAQARALQALRDGFAQGQDRRKWILVVRDEVGAPLMELTLGEAAGPSLRKLLM